MYYIQAKDDKNIIDFFNTYNANNTYFNTDGSNNISVDGSGIDCSVTLEIGKSIELFMNSIFSSVDKRKLKVLDIGSGLGYFQKALNGGISYDVYSFEGSAELLDSIVCDKNKIAICDFSRRICDERLKKAFNITTSFEVIEHIHKNHQEEFWNNIIKISDFHLCSIHMNPHNDSVDEHCFVKSSRFWETFFVKNKIRYTNIGRYPRNKGTELEPFRTITGIDSWNFSIMYLLQFKK